MSDFLQKLAAAGTVPSVRLNQIIGATRLLGHPRAAWNVSATIFGIQGRQGRFALQVSCSGGNRLWRRSSPAVQGRKRRGDGTVDLPIHHRFPRGPVMGRAECTPRHRISVQSSERSNAPRLNDGLDVHNGLLLSAPWDAAFDRGLISFADDGEILASPALGAAARDTLSLSTAPRLAGLRDEHRVNLALHRARSGL
jgi:hypothetical protein